MIYDCMLNSIDGNACTSVLHHEDGTVRIYMQGRLPPIIVRKGEEVRIDVGIGGTHPVPVHYTAYRIVRGEQDGD